MGAATALPVRDVRAEPGSTTTITMTVRNTGQVVDQFAIEVLGDAAPWAQASPAVANLLPGADVEVTITFSPPRDPTVVAGMRPFGVRVASREDPPGSSVAEGSVDVAAFDDVQVELVPRQSRGRRRGRHQVAIDNNGNQPTAVEVTANDEEEALDFRFDHKVATIQPGAAAFIRVIAKPEKRFFKGADRQHQFIVTVSPSTSTPVATRGTMTQRQLLPSWLIPAVAVLMVLALAGFVLYQTLLKSAIQSSADDAAKKAVKKQASSASAAVKKAQADAAGAKDAAKKAQAAASSAVKAGGANGGKPATSTKPSGGLGPGNVPLDTGSAKAFMLQTDADPKPGNFTSFTTVDGPKIAPNKLLVITAIILQNPNGDEGTMQIQRGSNEILLREGLAFFRDLDYHFDDEPLVFTSKQPLQLAINCQKSSRTRCSPSVLFTGRFVTTKKAP